MNQDAIFKELTPVFAEIFDDDSVDISPQTTADDVPGWDSLSNVRLMIALENKFKIRLKAVEISRLKNVGELAQLIKSKLT